MREVAAFICDDKRTRARLFGGKTAPNNKTVYIEH